MKPVPIKVHGETYIEDVMLTILYYNEGIDEDRWHDEFVEWCEYDPKLAKLFVESMKETIKKKDSKWRSKNR
jgi:hypothetical protein